MRKRLTCSASSPVWSFFYIVKDGIGFLDLFLRLGFDHFAQAIAHPV
jgi:hypothetical protein